MKILFLRPAGSFLVPVTRILYLGMLINSTLQAFLIPEDKRTKSANVRESVLDHKSSIPFPGGGGGGEYSHIWAI